jgi:hypothetical protein
VYVTVEGASRGGVVRKRKRDAKAVARPARNSGGDGARWDKQKGRIFGNGRVCVG